MNAGVRGLMGAVLLSLIAASAQSGTTKFYGGDIDGVYARPSVEWTTGSYTTFDDFSWAGGTVEKLFGNYWDAYSTPVVRFDYEIRSGMTSSSLGTLVASGSTTSFTWTDTGTDISGYDIYAALADVTDFSLTAGTYHLGLQVVTTAASFPRVYVGTTSGTNGVGSPINNGNAFWTLDNGSTTTISRSSHDYSLGVIGSAAAVPLPPAALAGFGLLGLLGVVRKLRRRKA